MSASELGELRAMVTGQKWLELLWTLATDTAFLLVRHSAGATLGAAAMRAIASGAAQAEQEGPALSVLVLPQDTSA